MGAKNPGTDLAEEAGFHVEPIGMLPGGSAPQKISLPTGSTPSLTSFQSLLKFHLPQ